MKTITDVVSFLVEAKVFYLATCEKDQPRVRPFGAVDYNNGRLYIQTGKKKDVSRQMHENPKIEICCFNKGRWLRIAAEAVEDPSIEAQQHLLDVNPGIKRLYKAGDGNTEVFYLKNAKAVFYSFAQGPEEVEF